MDEEDYFWLEMMNKERQKNHLSEVSSLTFENLMNTYEEETYFQSQYAGEAVNPSMVKDAVCCVCNNGKCQNSSAILFRDMCNLAFHQGVPYIPERQRRCLQAPSKAVDCELCPNKGGAFKRTNSGTWAHVICALWIPEVRFDNMLLDIDNIPPARWKLFCYICRLRNVGSCIQCRKSNCFTTFHVTCAQQAGLYIRMDAVLENNANYTSYKVRKIAFCQIHTPADTDTNEDDEAESNDIANGQFISLPTTPPEKVIKISSMFQMKYEQTFLRRLFAYWILKRQSRNGVPLLRKLKTSQSSHRGPNLDKKGLSLANKLRYSKNLMQDLEFARFLVKSCSSNQEKASGMRGNIRKVTSEKQLEELSHKLYKSYKMKLGISRTNKIKSLKTEIHMFRRKIAIRAARQHKIINQNLFKKNNSKTKSASTDQGKINAKLQDNLRKSKEEFSSLTKGSLNQGKAPGMKSESAVESPQVSRSVPSFSNNASAEHIIESEPMGYIYAVDNQGFSVEPRVTNQSALCTSTGLGGVSLVVAPSTVGPQTYQHASSSGAMIHHIPSSSAHALHPHSPASARPATPLSVISKSPAQGPLSVHSRPLSSPLQMTRSPLPSHTPSPAAAWSPAPPVLSPVANHSQSMPPLTFQQSHNQLIKTTCNVPQFVMAIATPQTLTQKLAVQQQQQQLFLQQQVAPTFQPQSTSPLTAVTTVVTTATPPVVQLIPALQSNVILNTLTSHSTTVRPIQPKHPRRILPKPATPEVLYHFKYRLAPATKQAPPPPVTAGQRTVGAGIQSNPTGQLVVGQGQSGMFSGPQGTILLNQIIPGMGQSPMLIRGNLTNVQGLQLTLRPPNSASPGQSLNTNNQNNATIIAALQNPSQHAPTLFAPTKSQPIHGQQTIVIPSNLAHHGLQSPIINLTSTGIPNSGIMSTSSHDPNQRIQLQQIQTPSGPILACIPSQAIAVQHLPIIPTLQNTALGNAQLTPVSLPMHSVMAVSQGVISGLSLQSHAAPPALPTPQQSLFSATVPFSSHFEQHSPHIIQMPPLQSSQIYTNHTVNQISSHPQSVEHSPKAPSPTKTSKGPVVLNLEDILIDWEDLSKETGIVPENFPPLSPENSVIQESVPTQLQASTTVVQSPQQLVAASLQGQVVLEQVSQNLSGQSSISQMELAQGQDGSVILQQHNSFGGTPRVQQYIQSPEVQARAVNTVNSVSSAALVSSSESAIARSHANLVPRLNSPPPVSEPNVSSLGVSLICFIGILFSLLGVSLAPSLTTTVTVTTLRNTVPLTVQSINVNSFPITSTGYVMQKTNVPEMTFFTEHVSSSQNSVTVKSEISSTTQSVQRINRINSGFQKFVSCESIGNSMQNTLKTVQSMPVVSTTNRKLKVIIKLKLKQPVQ